MCGDLTTHGEPEQAAVLADACAGLDLPVFAVLGNHDWHANRRDELVQALQSGGIRVLDRDWAVCEIAGVEGEPLGIWAFLGTDRLAAPIAEHEPDLVLHGHAHAGTFKGAIGSVPVYNVSVPVIERDF